MTGIADSSRSDEHHVGTCRSAGHRLRIVIVGGIGEVLGEVAEAVRGIVDVTEDAQLAAVLQTEVKTCFHLRGGGILHAFGILHIIHLRMIGYRLVVGIGESGLTIHIFLVGIEIVKTRSLGVKTYTCTDVKPLSEGKREVETR